MNNFLIKIRNKDNSIFLIVFLLTITVLTMPLIQNELISGDDIFFHLSRIQSLADSINSRIFPVKINASMANGFGYASSIFYPDLFLYFPAILIAFFNISLMNSYKIFIVFLFILMFFVFYYSFKYLSNNKEIALFGTAFLMLSKVVILILYSRFALGEFIGFIFVLPAIVGMYDYLFKGFNKPQLLIISFFGLINSHLITGLIVLFFCLLLFIINIKISIKNPKIFVKLVLCTFLVLLMSIYFWLPLIEQLSHLTFNLSKSWTNIGNEIYTFYDYFTNLKYSIGYSIIITLPVMIYMFINNENELVHKSKWKSFFIYYILFTFILVFPFIWKMFNNKLNVLQFKWRLLGIITTIYSVSLILLLSQFKEYFNASKLKIYLLISFSVLFVFTLNNYNRLSIGNITYNNETILKNIYFNIESIGGGFEYLPIEITSPLGVFQKNTNNAIGNEKEITGAKSPNLRYSFNYEEKMGNIIEIPYIYYYGYVANIKTTDETIKPLEVIKGSNGLVNIKIDNIESGEVRVWYNGTKIQKISLIISVLSTLILLIKTRFTSSKKCLKNATIYKLFDV